MEFTEKFFENSDHICRYVAERTDTILLSFSCGKDSIAAWLHCKKYFKNIIPFMFYVVPDLKFVEASIKYYENFFGTHIIRLPHPAFLRMLTNSLFQPFGSELYLLEHSNLQEAIYDHITIADCIRKAKNLDMNLPVAVGVRAADSARRQLVVRKNGVISTNRKTFYPIFDYKKEDVVNIIRQANLKLPFDYHMFYRSYDGLMYLYVEPIKRYFPEDYERIKEYFPMVEAEIKRVQYREEYLKRKDGTYKEEEIKPQEKKNKKSTIFDNFSLGLNNF